ncbi:MAG TPA: stage V sporulation protein T, partial [Clostridiales bacterium]|nr:stage V sporulation protein T [Clostridiales bacterium]
GDAIGAVMLLSKEPGAVISPTDVKVAETAANFMGKQLEN